MKAELIKVDGTRSEIIPKFRFYLTLEEAQDYVGGYIEVIDLPNNKVMIVNEEGLLLNLPVN